MVSAFAHLSPEQRQVALQIKRAAAEECQPGSCPIAPFLDDGVEDAVLKHWGSGSITNFVPLLALRNVRCCIRSATCDCGEC